MGHINSTQKSGQKQTVMVVDDEPVVRETIVEILRDEGFEALGMSDAAHAIAWAQRIRPDIILSDIVMPGMNGIDMAAELASILPACRIILFTGHEAAADLLEKARAEGHEFEVFEKPIDPGLLIPRLHDQTSHLRSGAKK
jgi:DNA-binding NtrC family response regulator